MNMVQSNMLKHGEYSMVSEGAIIRTKMIGSFNENGMKPLIEDLTKEVLAQNGQPFVELFDFTEFEGMTPEAFQLVDKYNHWVNRQRFVAKALVCDTSLFEALANKLIEAQKSQKFKTFLSITEAEKWLMSELDEYYLNNF